MRWEDVKRGAERPLTWALVASCGFIAVGSVVGAIKGFPGVKKSTKKETAALDNVTIDETALSLAGDVLSTVRKHPEYIESDDIEIIDNNVVRVQLHIPGERQFFEAAFRLGQRNSLRTLLARDAVEASAQDVSVTPGEQIRFIRTSTGWHADLLSDGKMKPDGKDARYFASEVEKIETKANIGGPSS